VDPWSQLKILKVTPVVRRSVLCADLTHTRDMARSEERENTALRFEMTKVGGVTFRQRSMPA